MMKVSMEAKYKKNEIIPLAISVNGDERYILDYKDNYLYKDCNNGECEFISDIKREKGEFSFEYMGIIQNKAHILVIPNNGKSFLLFDILEKKAHKIDVDEKVYINNINKPGFNKLISYKNKIFAVKYICNSICCINKDTLNIYYIDFFDDTKQNFDMFRTVGDCYCHNNYMYIPLADTNRFIVFNMDNYQYETKQIDEDIHIATICGYESIMYVVEMDGKKIHTINLSKWNVEDTIDLTLPREFRQDLNGSAWNMIYIGSIYYKSQLWLIPFAGSNMLVKVDLKNRMEYGVYKHNLNFVQNYWVNENQLWIFTDEGTMKINMDTMDIQPLCFHHTELSLNRYILHKLNYRACGDIIYESDISLDNYIRYILLHNKV